MRNGALLSALLHGGVVLLFLIGLPDFFRHDLEPPPIIPIEVINIADLTQAPDLKVKPKEDGPTEEPKEKPHPPKPIPVAEKIPEPEPETKLDPEPTEPDLTMDDLLAPIVEEKPKEKPKEKKKKEKKKEKPQKKKSKKDFTKLLNDIEKTESSSEGPTQPEQDETSTADNAANHISDTLSITETDLIRRQLEKHWIVPAGAKNAKDFKVEIRITLNSDCTVHSTTVIKTSKPTSDATMKAFADSANRAIHKSKQEGPLKLPLDRCPQLKTIVIGFDPSHML
jgi:outer membrane biosynthesis protein TonB